MNLFVLMPFDPSFDPIYSCIRDVSAKLEIEVKRADEIFNTNAIIQDIVDHILEADFIVADVTGKNPNVFYELGFAHASKRNAIIITQDINDVPFDIRHLRIIEYRNEFSGSIELSDRLLKMMSEAIKTNDKNKSDKKTVEDEFSLEIIGVENREYLDGLNKVLKYKKALLRFSEKSAELKNPHKKDAKGGLDPWKFTKYEDIRKYSKFDTRILSEYLDVLEYSIGTEYQNNITEDIIFNIIVPIAFLGGTWHSDQNAARKILRDLSIEGPFKIDQNIIDFEKKFRIELANNDEILHKIKYI